MPRFFSLRLKTLLLALLLTLSPLILLSVSIVGITQDELKSALNDNLVDTARQLTKEFDSLFVHAWRTPLLLLRNALDNPRLGTEEKISLLAGAARGVEDFLALQLVVEGFPPSLFVRRDLARQLERLQIVPEQALKVTLPPADNSRIIPLDVRPLGPTPLQTLPLVLSLNTPIKGRPAYLVAFVGLERIGDFLEAHPFSKIGQLLLLDSNGQTLFEVDEKNSRFRPPTEEALNYLRRGFQVAKVQPFVAGDGGRHLGVQAMTDMLPWVLVISVAERDAYQTISHMLYQLGLWLLAGVVFAVAVALWFAAYLTGPILRVTEVAQQVERGNLEVRVPPLNTRDELSRLAESINQMIQGLLALNAARAGSFHYDREADSYQVDSRTQEIFGLPPRQGPYTYADWCQCLYPEDREQADRLVREALDNSTTCELEYRIIRPDGQVRHVRSQAFVLRDEQGARLAGLHADITLQKQAEAELIRARDAAQAASQAKSAFLANMSHELRTPLNAVLGYAQLLEQNMGLAAQYRHQAQIIRRSGEYLLTLIDDILDLAKIEAGRFELFPAPCALEHFFQSLVDIFRIRAEQKNIRFQHQSRSSLPQSVECDEKRMRQIFMNLLGNALKFTTHGEVSLITEYRPDGRLVVEVRDTGPGISSRDIDRIFEPFHQSGGREQKLQGTGLGLSITRRLVGLMQGDLRVSSTPGRGSVFTVELPLPRLTSTALCQTKNQSKQIITGYHPLRSENTTLRLLIADDNPENRALLESILSPLGFELAEAHDGREALRLARNWRPHALLLDMVMPEMDGLEIVHQLRRWKTNYVLPIIALSANAFPEDKQRALDAGCDAYLAKPIKLDALFETLSNLLPLQWIYHQPAQVETEKSEDGPPASPDEPPMEEFARLLYLARGGDIQGLREHLDHLREKHGHSPTLDKIQELARTFRLKEIRSYLENKTVADEE